MIQLIFKICLTIDIICMFILFVISFVDLGLDKDSKLYKITDKILEIDAYVFAGSMLVFFLSGGIYLVITLIKLLWE